MQRRTFLKTLGGAMGTLILSSCGGSFENTVNRGGGSGELPTGYKFHSLIGNGGDVVRPQAGPTFAPVSFPGSAIINDLGEAYVHVDDEAGLSYLVKLQLDGTEVVSRETVAWQGMDLPGGLSLKQLDLASTNDRGDLVFRGVLSNLEHGYYLHSASGENLRVVAPRRPAPDSEGVFGHVWGDFQLLDDGSLLLIGSFTDDPKSTLTTRSGLFHFPRVGQSEGGRRVLASGDLVPGTDERVGVLGLLDGDGPEGHYVVQVGLAHPRLRPGDVPTGKNRTLLMGGLVSEQNHRMVTLEPSITVSPALSGALPKGQVTHGGRVAADGTVAGVVEPDSTGHELFYGDQMLLKTGQSSPLGVPIRGFSGPVVGPAGIVACHLFTEGNGEEIVVSNGRESRTVLASGTALGGKTIQKMAFGLVRDQVDFQGRILVVALYTDQSQALLLGQPV